jgi:hypothetical protein
MSHTSNVRFISAELLVFIFVTVFQLQQKPVGLVIRIVVSPHDVSASVDPEVSGDVTAREPIVVAGKSIVVVNSPWLSKNACSSTHFPVVGSTKTQ